MRRFSYVIEDLDTNNTYSRQSPIQLMKDARTAAKALSIKTGHPIAVIAVDSTDGSWISQGVYYGRTWRVGAHRRYY